MSKLNKKNILIIEDERAIGELLSYSLTREGFNTAYSETGFDGIKLIDEFKPDLIVLDIMLPDISGFDVCRKVSAEYKIPIVMLTAKTDIVDKILGMELGADDYITKPFDIREAIVRIKAIFRRIDQVKESIDDDKDIVSVGNDIKIIKESRTVTYKNETVVFTPKEYDLLLLLSEGKGKVFTREQILNEVWGFDFYGDTRTVDIHIQRIRKKLGMKNDNNIIKTIFGVGYRLD
ncbi:response regulator transcription factor [Clostridium neuense]|uniref:Stage 0 sporulation protein A homolog n=1 Tax=Clostridium neuense TaxID=1728934 RepID=A0ABW8TNN6_9CLOT